MNIKAATTARKSRKPPSAAVTSVSTDGLDATSPSATRNLHCLSTRPNISDTDKEADDKPACRPKQPAQENANIEQLAPSPAAITSRTSSSGKRSATHLSEDIPSTTSTPKSSKKARNAVKIEFDEDEPAVLPAGPSQTPKLFDGSKLSADVKRKVKVKGKDVVDKQEAERVRFKNELAKKEKLAKQYSQTLDSIRSSVSCGLCNELFNNPHSLKCGHIFCRKCLEIAWTAQPDSNDTISDSDGSASATDTDADASGDESDASAALYPRRRLGLVGFRPLGAWLDDDENDEAEEAEDEEEDDHDTAPYRSAAFYGLTIGKKRVVEVDNLRDEDALTAFNRASEMMLNDFVAYSAARHQRRRAPLPTPSVASSGARIEEIDDDDEAAGSEQYKAEPSRARNGRREPVSTGAGSALALTRRPQGAAFRRSPSPTPASSRWPSPVPSPTAAAVDGAHVKEVCCPTCGVSCLDSRPTRIVLYGGILDVLRKADLVEQGFAGRVKSEKKEKESGPEEDETWSGVFPVGEKNEEVVLQVAEKVDRVEKQDAGSVALDDGDDAQHVLTGRSDVKEKTGDVEKTTDVGKAIVFVSKVEHDIDEPAGEETEEKDVCEIEASTIATIASTTTTAAGAETHEPSNLFGITAFRTSSFSSTSLSNDSSFATSASAFGLLARSRSRTDSSSSASSASSHDSTSTSSITEELLKDPSARHIRGDSERKNKADGSRLETEMLTRSASPSSRIARTQQGREPRLGSDSIGSSGLSSTTPTGEAEVRTSKAASTRRTSRKRAREEEEEKKRAPKEVVAKGKKARRG
ncbi:zinc finger, RING-type protein [Rhodotorula toruloides]|uniref:Zinc finger, RING-type protein n=1 Tax=Rhodotorula toruloides TaxID=5286 RepID=A0A511KFT7_RHOTO|nr:zinc finger, RING-type protein [Rhodotorula toruloides]